MNVTIQQFADRWMEWHYRNFNEQGELRHKGNHAQNYGSKPTNKEKSMPSIEDVYQSTSRYLKAEDLQGGKPVVEIESAEAVENTYNGETKHQIVLTFTGKDKVLGLNVTNARRIAMLTGTTDYTQWIGFKLKLYVDQTDFNGKTVDCIRIWPDLPEQTNDRAKAAAAAHASDSDIPF